MPFTEHLCAKQQVTLSTFKTSQSLFQLLGCSNAVSIELLYVYTLYCRANDFYSFHRSHTFTFKRRVPAMGTGILYGFCKIAVVTFQMPVVSMQCHSHRTVRTEMCFSTTLTIEVFEVPSGR